MTTVISNDLNSYPFKSLFSRLRKESEQDYYRGQLRAAAILLEEGNWDEARTILDMLIQKDPDYALTRFLRGQSLFAMKQYEPACDDFIQARDLDDFPVRAPTVINETIREICRREKVLLLDLEQLLREQSSHHIIGFNLCLDYLHHNLVCQQLIAEALLRFLNQENLLPPDLRAANSLPNPEQVNLHLGVTDRYPATRYLYIAFLYGFDDARTFYLDYARRMLELTEALWPEKFISPLALGVIRLRLNDPQACRIKWEPLLQRNPTQFFRIAEHLFSHWIRIIDDLILFKHSSYYLVPYFTLHGSLSKDLEKPPRRLEIDFPEDPFFLNQFRYAWERDAESGRLIDVSQNMAHLVKERRRVLDESPPELLRPTILRNFESVNCKQGNQAFSFLALNKDPHILFPTISTNPLLVHSIQIELEFMPPAGSDRTEFEATLYWATKSNPEFSEGRRLTFRIKPDGHRHDYIIPLANRWQWINSDTITRLRLDPADQPGSQFILHQLKIMPINSYRYYHPEFFRECR